MIRPLKRIIKIALIFALIMCWGISLGYTNNIAKEDKTINFYFEDDNYDVNFIKNIKESEKTLSIVGWAENSLQSAYNPDLNRTVDSLDVLLISGSSNLLVKGSMLFDDDLEGCLIDSDTSYKLFGSNNSVGKEIIYNDRSLIVRGILKGSKSNIMVQLPEDSNEALNGLTIDGTDFTLNKINDFKSSFGIKEMAIDGGIYYSIAKAITMIFPLIALILILIKIVGTSIKSRNKPILLLIYILMFITAVAIVFKVIKVNVSIPLDMIPNKWSDFDFWSKMWKEYSEKMQYVLYMKKYGVDIYSIENLLMSVLFSIFTIILFVINLKVIRASDIKELLINNTISVLCTFVTVLIVWSKYKFDVNVTMMWVIYPLYLCGEYFMKSHGKYLSYEENLKDEINDNEIEEAFC